MKPFTFSGATHLTFNLEIAMARPARAIDPVRTPRLATISDELVG